jgi:hypothetical protein
LAAADSSGVVSINLISPVFSWSTDIIEIHGKSAKYRYVDESPKI